MTVYPNQLDSIITLPTVAGATPEDIAINDLQPAVIAIETELGLDPKGIYSDVSTRLDILESRIGPGAGNGGGLIDINTDTAGQLAVNRGGTGFNAVGAVNTVITSTGVANLYKLLTDANIDSAAAIAGTKISPNFGSQLVQTTGNTQAASFILGSSGPTITTGTGAPATSPPNGSIFLRQNGTGNTGIYTRQSSAWSPVGAAPGGSNTQVQFNDSSTLNGDAGLTFVKATGTLATTILNTTYAAPNPPGTIPASGFLRFPYNGGATVDKLVRVLDSVATERTVIDFGAGDLLTFGNTAMIVDFNGFQFNGSFAGGRSNISHAGFDFTPFGVGTPILSLENSSLIKILAAETLNLSTADGYTSTKEEELKTTDSSDHAIASFAITSNSAAIIDIEILAIKGDHTVMLWWKKSRAYLNNAGSVTAGTQRDVDTETVGTGTPTWTVALSAAAGGTVDVNVNGQGDTVTWYIIRQAMDIKPAP